MGRISSALGAVTAAVLAGAVMLCVQADTYDISQGDIRIITEGTKQTVIYQNLAREDAAPVVTGQGGSVVLEAKAESTLTVTFQDVTADFSGRTDIAPVTVQGEGRILLELDGINTLTGGSMHAALETGKTALYITDDREPMGILNAQGGRFAAGIGGGAQCDGGNVFILGGSINAHGGTFGAGIGGGQNGSGSRIAVLGGQVSTAGGVNAAGIGGGWCGSGEDLCITGGSLTATGFPAVQAFTLTPESDNLSLSDGIALKQIVRAGESLAPEAGELLVIAPAEETAEEAPETETPEDALIEETTETEETAAVPSESVPAEETEAFSEEPVPTEEAGTETEETAAAAENAAVSETAEPTAAPAEEAAAQAESTETAEETAEAAPIIMQNRDNADVEFTEKTENRLWTLRTECPSPVITVSKAYIEELQAKGVSMLRIFCGKKIITTNLVAIMSRTTQDTIILNVSNDKLRLVREDNIVDIPTVK